MNILEITLNYPNIIKVKSNLLFDGVFINSEVSPNNLFIGIIGERFDGAKFLKMLIKMVHAVLSLIKEARI